jgi:hypothetical protein
VLFIGRTVILIKITSARATQDERVVAVAVVGRRDEGVASSSSSSVHPGPWTSMEVVGLPEALQVAERNTCWAERPEFGGRCPSAAFARLFDQTGLGSQSHRTEEPPRIPGDLVFPAPFSIEAIPWVALGRLATTFPEALGLEILRDWCLILRSALSRLRPSRGGEVYYSRSELALCYERAVLRWLIQRFAFERLRPNRYH